MTTRELTPEQTAEALAIIRETTSSHHWANWDPGDIECIFCGEYASSFDELEHHERCPVTRAAALLAAVDSAQEADE